MAYVKRLTEDKTFARKIFHRHGEISFKKNLLCLWKIFFVFEISYLWNVLSMILLSMKCLSIKCLSMKCLSMKYLSMKCLSMWNVFLRNVFLWNVFLWNVFLWNVFLKYLFMKCLSMKCLSMKYPNATFICMLCLSVRLFASVQ